MSDESELDQLRRKLQEAEQRAAAAEQREQKERKEREEAEQREQKERKEREEAELREQIAQQREHDAKFINAKEQLQKELPGYSETTHDKKRSYTKADRALYRPSVMAKWDVEFEGQMVQFLQLVQDREVPRRDDIIDPQYIEANVELQVQGFVQNLLQHTTLVVREALQEQRLELIQGIRHERDRDGGIPDILVSLNNVVLYVAELKRPSVHFNPGKHLADEDIHATTVNALQTLIQTYSYMIAKGQLVYGFFTNYNYWAFLKRTKDANNRDVLNVTRLFDKTEARLALATFLRMVTRLDADNVVSLPIGEGVEQIGGPPSNAHGAGGATGGTSAAGGTTTTTTTTDGGGGGGASTVVSVRRAKDFFDVGTVVAGVVFTTTQQMLGVKSLSVHARADSEFIASSEKSCSFRYRGNGKDWVWRQIDVYGLPRSCPDYSLAALQDMVTCEIEAYVHLRAVWGELVPHFVYFGNDFAMLWAFVTTYEGQSLRTIEKETGGLTQSTKTAARRALIRLHQLGVIHGDAVLRNVLRRESDGQIIWIDFEFSTVLSETNAPEFGRLAEREIEAFDSELTAIPTLPEPTVIPTTAEKRTKVFCTGCNPCSTASIVD